MARLGESGDTAVRECPGEPDHALANAGLGISVPGYQEPERAAARADESPDGLVQGHIGVRGNGLRPGSLPMIRGKPGSGRGPRDVVLVGADRVPVCPARCADR